LRDVRVRRLVPLAWLTLLAGFFLREALFEGRVFYERDLHLQWYGQAERFVACLAEGAWPLWDPYVSFGQPLLANPNNQLLYPFTWLNLLVRPSTYYTLFLGAHLAFAGLGLLALARRLGLSESASLVTASLWIASGPLLSLGNLWNHLAAAAWMPWVVVACDRAIVGPSARAAVLVGAALALQVATGSPEVVAMTALLAAAITVRHWGRPRAERARAGVAIAVGAALGLLLSAAQWLPSLELAAASSRRNLGAAEALTWSVHPLLFLQAAVPVFWEDAPWSDAWRAALFEDREPYLHSLYCGLPTLLLATFALRRRREPAVCALLALAALAAGLALGRHLPPVRALFELVPLAGALRFPAKGLVLAGACLALLAGVGFDAWRAAGARRASGVAGLLLLPAAGSLAALATQVAPASVRLGLAAGVALACAAALRARVREARWASASAMAVAALGVLDLTVAHRDIQPTAPRELLTFRPDVIGSIDQRDLGRLFVYDYAAAPGLARRHLDRDVAYVADVPAGDRRRAWRGAFALRSYLLPPTGAARGVYSSYERDLLRLQPRPLVYLNAALAFADATPLFVRLLRLGAVRHAIALHDPGLAGLALRRTLPGPFLEPMQVFEVEGARPRAYVVDGVRVADGLGGIDALLAPDFDPASEIVLPSGAARLPDPAFRAAAAVVQMRADGVRLRAEASAPGFLVLADAFDPGWTAQVDGQPAPVLRANVAFRAVPVPAGRHDVELLYRPASVRVGVVLSALGLVACAVLVARTG